MEKEFFGRIYKKHLTKLKNIEIPHKKLVVCFSAVPGSGKTHIARILEKRYKAVRINNDDIRKIIKVLVKKNKNLAKEDRQTLLLEYLLYLIKNFSFANKLIILDSSIDRKYKMLIPVLKKNDFRFFVIRLGVSTNVLKKRISFRAKKAPKHFKEKSEDWFKDYEDCRKSLRADIIIKNEGWTDLSNLFSILDRIIK